MNRAQAWAVASGMVAASVVAFAAPLPAVAALATTAAVWLRTRRIAFLGFAAFTLLLDATLFAVLLPGPEPFHVGPVAFGAAGAARGVAGGLRVLAVLGSNLALLSWWPVERVLDGLGLPRRAIAFLGAVLLAAHDLGRDAVRLAMARRLDGAWPRRRLAQAAAAAALVPALAVLAVHRARTRADALRLAGQDTGPRFAPLVAVTALAVAARMALAAGANVSLTYVVVFAGGMLFGPFVGAWAAVLAMAMTDLLLSGAYVLAFANAPAMALVGLAGAGFGRVRSDGAGAEAWTMRLLAASCGIAATLAFSAAADTLTWVMVPEFHADVAALRALVLAGLAFNAIPAAVNAVLFGAVVGPLASAARHADVLGAAPRAAPREAQV